MKVETPILKRMGPVPFWRGERKCLDSLEEVYRKAVAMAEEALHPAPPAPERRRRSAGRGMDGPGLADL